MVRDEEQAINLTRRQFLALAPALPVGLSALLAQPDIIIIAGFVADGVGPDGWPLGYRWVESGSLADVTNLGPPGYVAIYTAGLDREWLDEFRDNLQDLFPEAEKTYLPLIFKNG